MTVVVVGSANVDHVVQVTRLPEGGETVLGSGYGTGAGGKGLNQAVAAARQRAAVVMVAALGADGPGDTLASVLAAENVNAGWVRRVEGAPTGVALITVAGGGDNTIVVVPGANAALRASHLPALRPGDVVLTQLEIPLETAAAALRAGRAAGARTVLNPAPAAGPLPEELLDLVDVLVPNETEAAALAGVASPAEAAARLAEAGRRSVIVTVGSRGCLIAGRGAGVRAVEAFAVSAVDSTGAGDAFCGTLAAGLDAGLPLHAAVRRASAAGALAAGRPGAVASLPDRAAVDRFLNEGR